MAVVAFVLCCWVRQVLSEQSVVLHYMRHSFNEQLVDRLSLLVSRKRTRPAAAKGRGVRIAEDSRGVYGDPHSSGKQGAEEPQDQGRVCLPMTGGARRSTLVLLLWLTGRAAAAWCRGRTWPATRT